MVVAIVIAHVFLWRSGMALHLKIAFTTINTIAWTVILAPILLIDRWLDAVKSRNSEPEDD